MATEFLYLKGKVKWCRPQQPDPWGNWKTEFYPIPEDLAKIKALKETSNGVTGIKNTIKKDEDGEYVSLRRPQSKLMRGKVTGFAPPEVLDGSVVLPDGSNPPLRDTPIGNGTDATVKISVYTHSTPGGGKARATRWEAIRVDNLVPYKGRDEFTEGEEKQIRGLAESPKPLW
jgi:hypothetical protein